VLVPVGQVVPPRVVVYRARAAAPPSREFLPVLDRGLLLYILRALGGFGFSQRLFSPVSTLAPSSTDQDRDVHDPTLSNAFQKKITCRNALIVWSHITISTGRGEKKAAAAARAGGPVRLASGRRWERAEKPKKAWRLRMGGMRLPRCAPKLMIPAPVRARLERGAPGRDGPHPGHSSSIHVALLPMHTHTGRASAVPPSSRYGP
jgi:hypothetical protein